MTTSLRWRLTSSFVVLTVVVLTIMDVVVYLGVARERGDRLRDEATQRAAAAALIYASTGALVPGATLNDTSAPARLRQGVAESRNGSQLVEDAGHAVVWAAVSVGGGAAGRAGGVFVQASAESDERALAALRTGLAVASSAILVLAAGAGAALASRLVRGLSQAALVARRIADGDLDARVGAQGRDEVAALARVVDQMAGSVQHQLQRERRFIADAAHELRTPVTGLVAAAYLLPEDDPATAMVQTEAARLHRLVDDLLEVSRLESGHEPVRASEVDLAALATVVAARYPGIEVTGAGRATTDPHRLERVLVNLLDNATRHGRPPVRLEVSGRGVAVVDRGPGFPADLLGRLTEPFVTSGGGTGLGLAIVAEQARVLGATLDLHDVAGGGARAALTLPPADPRWPVVEER